MSETKNETSTKKRPYVSTEAAEITKRFFLAIDTLRMQKKIHSILQFTKKYNINRWNLYTIKDNPDVAALKVEYIYYLCRDYNVSLDWIFYGTGDFYNISAIVNRKKL